MFRRSSGIAATTASAVSSPVAESASTRKRQKLSGGQYANSGGSEQQSIVASGKELLHAIEILADQRGRAISGPFMKLPSKKLYPDYYTIITKPVALDQIRQALEDGDHVTFNQIKDDLLQMTNNAKRYNQKGSQLYTDASQIARVVKNWSGNPEAYSEDSEPDVVTQELSAKTFRNILNAKVREILQGMREAEHNGRKVGEPFLELPEKRLYPDYYTLIVRPLSINLLASKMRKNPYAKISKFEKDLDEMFENAHKYNQASSQVAKDAKELRKITDKLLAEAKPILEQQEKELSAKVIMPSPIVTRTPQPAAQTPVATTPSTINTGGFKIKLGLRQPQQTTPTTKVKLNLTQNKPQPSSLSKVLSQEIETPAKREPPKASFSTSTRRSEIATPPVATTPRVATPNIPNTPLVSSPLPASENTIIFENPGAPLISSLSLAAPQMSPPVVLHIPSVPSAASALYSWTLPVQAANMTVSPTLTTSLNKVAVTIFVNGRKIPSTRTGSSSITFGPQAGKGNSIWDIKLSTGMNCIECIAESSTATSTEARERVAVLILIK